MVASGERQPFKKKLSSEASSSSKPTRVHGPVINWVNGPVINWVGVTNAEDREKRSREVQIPSRNQGVVENEDLGVMVEILKVGANAHERGHNVVVRVPTAEMALHLERRVNENHSHIWFRSGTCHRVDPYGVREVTLQVHTIMAAHALDVKEIAETISKIVRLDSMTQEQASAALAEQAANPRRPADFLRLRRIQDERALASAAAAEQTQMTNTAAAAAAADQSQMASAVASATAVEGHQMERAVASAAAAEENTPSEGRSEVTEIHWPSSAGRSGVASLVSHPLPKRPPPPPPPPPPLGPPPGWIGQWPSSSKSEPEEGSRNREGA